MAEQEVIKHTKKVYKIWHSKEHSVWQKVKDFLLEIFIIVFAISLSIWFHNKSEHTHQQEDVKQFLLGLKSDLGRDLDEMQEDIESYQSQKTIFNYITGIKLNQSLNNDTLIKYQKWLFNYAALNPNDGRFEGFKSSGKIATIENNELQNDILDFYQEDIVALRNNTTSYINIKMKFYDFIFKNRKKLTDSTTNMNTILAMDEAQNICLPLSYPNETLSRYDTCVNKAKKIIAEINKEYGLKD